MKPIMLALLGSAALAFVPGSAQAQVAASLNCDDTTTATPTPGATTAPGVDLPTGPGGVGTPTPSPTLPYGDPGTGGDGVTGGGGTGTPTPTATPTPTPTPATSAAVPYMPASSTAGMKVTSSVHGTTTVKYYRANGIDSDYKQNLSAVKSYPTPSGNGVVVTIGGQKILAKDSAVKISGLSQGIINAIDEINLSAAALGLPDPVITAGHDQAGHSSNSDHYTGNALDLRCNTVSTTACKQWVLTLQNALGSGYDVLFEDWGGSNSHVHVAYG